MKLTQWFRTSRVIVVGFVFTWALVCFLQLVQHKIADSLYAVPTKPYVSVNASLQTGATRISTLGRFLNDLLHGAVQYWEFRN